MKLKKKDVIYYARINDLNSDVTEQDLNTEIKVGNYTFTQVNKIKKAEMSVKVFAWETERDNNLWSLRKEHPARNRYTYFGINSITLFLYPGEGPGRQSEEPDLQGYFVPH